MLTSLTLHHNSMKIENAPRLRDVDLEFAREMTLPWRQITSLTLTWLTTDDCLAAIQRCPQLNHCGLACITAGHQFAVTAPSVKSLSWEKYPSEMLDALTVPNARDMLFRRSLVPPRFIFFIRRSMCPLEQLSLHDIEISETWLLDCLRTVPSLAELHLTDLKIINDRVHTVHSSNIHDPLLPDLQVLTYSGIVLFDHIGLAAVMSTRWTSAQSNDGHRVVRLQTVDIKSIIPVMLHQQVFSEGHLVTNGMHLSLLLLILDRYKEV
jgi:hypothetical protein